MKKIYTSALIKGAGKIIAAFRLTIAAAFLIFSTDLSAQCITPGSCNFLSKIGGATSANGAEISAFDPDCDRVYTVAGPVVEYYNLSNTGALTLLGSLPLGFPLACCRFSYSK